MGKVCLPTVGDEGLEARVNAHFGSTPYFTLVDAGTGAVEVIANGNQRHEPGQCNPTGAIMGRSVEIVLCGGIGPGAISRLRAGGIRVYLTGAATVREALEQFSAGKLEEITSAQACAGHGGGSCG